MTQPYVGDNDWPSNYGGCRIQGTYIDFLARPVSGKLILKPAPSVLLNPTAKKILVSLDLEFNLDNNGSVDFIIPATNDTDLNPAGWTYTVIETFVGVMGRTYPIEAPVGATVNLVDVAPVIASTGNAIIRGPIGMSAYEVAVAGGFVGTQEEWLASLKGAPGTGGGASAPLTLSQTTPSASWFFTHNLGHYPLVSVMDSNNAMVLADVEYPSLNTLAVTLANAATGKVILL